jgi:hypothetical protein
VRRTQLYLDNDLWKALHTSAKQSGVTVSELVRVTLRKRYCDTGVNRKAAFENVIGLWKDRSDLGETGDYLRELRRGTRLKRLAR